MSQPAPAKIPSPADMALVASLAKLWPHREHESNAIKYLACRVGLHRWRQLDLSELHPGEEVQFCFWCPKIRVNGVMHDP